MQVPCDLKIYPGDELSIMLRVTCCNEARIAKTYVAQNLVLVSTSFWQA